MSYENVTTEMVTNNSKVTATGEVIAKMITELDTLPNNEDVVRVLRTVVAYYGVIDDLA